MFLGEFEHALDAKQRLAIPAEFRARWNTDSNGELVVAMPGPNESVWLWQAPVFEREMTGLVENARLGPDAIGLESKVFSKCRVLPMDGAGRIRIPDSMLADYMLKDRVIVAGVRNHLEVVNPEVWQRRNVTSRDVGQAYVELVQKRAENVRVEARRE